ncbi:MAG: CxxC-x17-CxxC domain-containing protein, partial [Candidatus Paceibacterota bacterium]
MGKTALLENMAIQDIRRGDGMGFVDPHGEAAEELLDYVPEERMDDVIYFNPADLEFPIAFNIMEGVSQEHRHLLASGLMGVFKKIWPDVWSARMEYILNNAVLALLEYPDSTLLGVHKMLSDEEYRKEVVNEINDPVVKSFWVNEFSRYSERYEVRAVAAIQNKIGQLIAAPLIRNIIGQVHSTIDIRKAMDEKKILIVNLSKGRIGEDASRLLGSMLVAKLQLAAMSRVDIPEENRKDFYLYVDEFQNFATESFVNILSEARKYRLDLTLAHQYIAQMEDEVRDAVFGNMGTLISFRVGAEDAEYLEKEFVPEFDASDLVNLPKFNIYLKLMIDGVAGRPFSATTLPPFEEPEETFTEKIIRKSQRKYGTKRKKVEKKISEWSDIAAETTQSQGQDQELYDVTCDRCGKETKVPFEPDPDRNVYCKSCLKKNNKEKEQKQKEEEEEDFPSKMSLRKALEQNNSTFTKGDEKQEKEDNKEEKKEEQEEQEEDEKSARDKVDTDSLKKLLEKSLDEDE